MAYGASQYFSYQKNTEKKKSTEISGVNYNQKNKSGVLGGLGYFGASLAAGIGSVGEGLSDLLLATGGLLTGKLSIEDNEALYFDLIEILMGENYTSYLINMLLRLLPKKILKTALYALADGAVDALVRTTTQLWALCPTEYYPEAREKWLTDDNYKVIRDKVDYFMEARADFEKKQNALIAKGASIYDIVCYDLKTVEKKGLSHHVKV